MKTRVALLAFVLPLVSSLAFAEIHPTTIYGDDDRLDVCQVKDPRVLALADSTVALFTASKVHESTATGRAALDVAAFGESRGLCKTERFWSQRYGAFCSGFLVGPDLLMTAGHCIGSEDSCKRTKFVFGFDVKKEGDPTDSVPAGEVYGCSALLGREQEAKGADWALVKLDRPVAGHKPLDLNRAGAIEKGAPLLVIGHPSGLPTKVAGGANVRDASPSGYFVANLDTYGGNSGSAVFNARTGLVEGILVRGETDYERSKDGCMVSKVCPNDGCRGEDVTRISSATAKLPLIAPPAEASRPAPPRMRASGKDEERIEAFDPDERRGPTAR